MRKLPSMVEALAGSGLAGNSRDCLIELIEAGTELEPVADDMEIESEKSNLVQSKGILTSLVLYLQTEQ
jgi:hypothetical protein